MKQPIRKILPLLGLGFVTAVGLTNCSNIIRTVGPKIYPEAVFNLNCTSKVVALTIDDGPFQPSTPKILKVLSDNQVKATFFAIGDRGQENLDLLQAITDQGHELANHTWAEQTTARLDEPELSQSIADTHALLAPYQEITWFRPGTGFVNQSILEAIAPQASEEIAPYNYRLALGDVFPFDTTITSPRFYSWYINHSVKPGSIIVLHDANGRGERTAAALAQVLPKLQARGYAIVPLRELDRPERCKPVLN